MGRISYVVTATLPDEPTLDRYVRWLLEGHVEAVIDAGAREGHVVRLEEPAEPPRVQARYVFPSREAFDTYVRCHAPVLREEGLRLFGSRSGVRFHREIGTILEPE